MPIINITTWPTPIDVKEKLMQEITRVTHEITKAPLDKITVLIQEVEKNSWCEAGALGSDVDFVTKSRRKEY
jgi:4-oxalocrotonate tautomerase